MSKGDAAEQAAQNNNEFIMNLAGRLVMKTGRNTHTYTYTQKDEGRETADRMEELQAMR